jgi:hypothetical protein
MVRPADPADELRRARLAAQLVSEPAASSPEEVTDHLLAVQAQDGRGARLAVRARSAGLTAADVDRALSERRSLVIDWLNRSTLHLVRAGDWWWLHPLTTPQRATASARRLRQEGVDERQAARGIAVVTEAVADRPHTRAELRALLDAAGVPTAGQALVHVLGATALQGTAVRGPMVGRDHAFVAPTRWLGPAPEPLERREALARLARRYLAGHGPADAADLARWAGIPLGQARQGFAAIAEEVEHRPDGLLDVSRPAAPALPPPRLLGPWDPLLLGWTSRAPFVGGHQGIVTNNGLFRPFALVDGRAVAIWSLTATALTIRPLEAIPKRATDRLRVDAAAVLAFLGLDVPVAVELPG